MKKSKSGHPLTAKAFGVKPKEASKIEAEVNAKLAASWEKLNCCQRAAMTLGVRMFQYQIQNLGQLCELQNLLNHLILQGENGKVEIKKPLMELMKAAGKAAEKPAEVPSVS